MDLSRPSDFLLDRVLYRDGLMLVIDKLAGIPVHRGPGGGESLEDYFNALRFGLPRPPALAHRLDRDTSGCLVLGRHPKALRKLGRLFAEGRIEKTYWAICDGAPAQQSGSVDDPLRKVSRKDGGWRMEVDEAGKFARTTYRVLASKDGFSFIEAKPKTGRTHQIRVHLAQLGTPIVGDPLYGGIVARDRKRPLMLHAWKLVIPISNNKDPVSIEAQPPDAMKALIDALS